MRHFARCVALPFGAGLGVAIDWPTGSGVRRREHHRVRRGPPQGGPALIVLVLCGASSSGSCLVRSRNLGPRRHARPEEAVPAGIPEMPPERPERGSVVPMTSSTLFGWSDVAGRVYEISGRGSGMALPRDGRHGPRHRQLLVGRCADSCAHRVGSRRHRLRPGSPLRESDPPLFPAERPSRGR